MLYWGPHLVGAPNETGRRLWTGLLTGPIIWFISLDANFALSRWVCTSRWKPAAWLVSLLALAVTAGAGLLSWSQWKQLGKQHAEAADHQLARPQAMAMGGALLSAGFLIVLAAQMLPELLMSGCE